METVIVEEPSRRYWPLLSHRGQYEETADEYITRVGSLLPNFPAAVLIQWFFEHVTAIDPNA